MFLGPFVDARSGSGCSKGKRECVYPPPPVQKTGSRAKLKGGKHPPIPESESSDEDEALVVRELGQNIAIRDKKMKDPPASRSPTWGSMTKGELTRRHSAQSRDSENSRQASETPSSSKEKSASPPSDITAATSQSYSSIDNFETTHATLESPLQIVSDLPGFSRLEKDVRFFLEYHQRHITVYHYFLMSPAENFIHREIVENAMKYKPLLYAVVGFAAYHFSVGNSNGKLYTFLKHYNRSVSLLRKSIQAGDRYSDAILLTILQLATFEVCLCPEQKYICSTCILTVVEGVSRRLGESSGPSPGWTSHVKGDVYP
jgi:hypothetical protein